MNLNIVNYKSSHLGLKLFSHLENNPENVHLTVENLLRSANQFVTKCPILSRFLLVKVNVGEIFL